MDGNIHLFIYFFHQPKNSALLVQKGQTNIEMCGECNQIKWLGSETIVKVTLYEYDNLGFDFIGNKF